MQLVTERLVLREAEPGDARALAAYQSDPRYLEHYAEAPDAESIVATAREWAAAAPRLNFQLIVTLREGGRVIGCAGIRQAGHACGEADLGIEVDPGHWGLGHAREAVTALIELARGELGVTRIFAETTPNNVRAQRLVMALGFSPVESPLGAARFVSDAPGRGRGGP